MRDGSRKLISINQRGVRLPARILMKTCGKPTTREGQFQLSVLFEFVTICSVLAAASPAIGAASSACLMLMSLAVWARQGFMALAMLAGACLATSPPLSDATEFVTVSMRECVVCLLGVGTCYWYRFRRAPLSRLETETALEIKEVF